MLNFFVQKRAGGDGFMIEFQNVSKIFKTKDVKFEGGKEYFHSERAAMGKMTAAEKKAIIVLVILMAYVMFQPVHGFNLNYVFIVLPWICFFPGVNIAPHESLNKVKMFFSTFAFAGTCMKIEKSHVCSFSGSDMGLFNS